MALVSLLLACTPPGPTGDDGAPPAPLPPDPDVATWVPDTFPPPAATRVIWFGDSITAGYGVEDRQAWPSLLEKNQDHAWPDDEGDDLRARFGRLEVLDVSRSGARTDDVVRTQLPAVTAAWGEVVEGPVLVAGTIGGNDVMDVLFSFGDIDAGLAEIVDNLREIGAFFTDPARFPDGVYLAINNVYEPTDGEGQAAECFYGLDLSGFIGDFDALNASTLALAQEQGWAWVDLHGHFVGHGFNFDVPQFEAYDEDDPTLWFQDDCIHPNARGHHELRRLVRAAFDAEPLPLVVPEAAPSTR